jgi:hypothetical protein
MATIENCNGTGANTRYFCILHTILAGIYSLLATALRQLSSRSPSGMTPSRYPVQPLNAANEAPSELSVRERRLPLFAFAQSKFFIDGAAGAQDVLRQRARCRGSIAHLESLEDFPVLQD